MIANCENNPRLESDRSLIVTTGAANRVAHPNRHVYSAIDNGCVAAEILRRGAPRFGHRVCDGIR